VFTMGSPAEEPGRSEGEQQHQRRIERSFAIAATEVTQAQYASFAKANAIKIRDQSSRTQEQPQISVSWFEAAGYCNWLSVEEGLDACYELDLESNPPKVAMKPDFLKLNGYRLPTEAEWEYACRSGVTMEWGHGRAERRLKHYAWYRPNRGHLRVSAVGRLMPNEAGLFDMFGNALEWCQERYLFYPQDTAIHAMLLDRHDSVDARSVRVLRGGSFDYKAADVRAANRNDYLPVNDDDHVSFRPSRTYP